MVVKTEDYYCFVGADGQLRQRSADHHPADKLRLISISGIRGFGCQRTLDVPGNNHHEIDTKIMRENFRTAITSAESGFLIAPAVGMGVWRGDPDVYWTAFLDAVLTTDTVDHLDQILVNPGHQPTPAGSRWEKYTGQEFAQILAAYKAAHPGDPRLARLDKIQEFDRDILLTAQNLKAEFPDKIVSFINASDPDVTLGRHVGEYVNNCPHDSTTEENYCAAGTSGLLDEELLEALGIPPRVIDPLPPLAAPGAMSLPVPLVPVSPPQQQQQLALQQQLQLVQQQQQQQQRVAPPPKFTKQTYQRASLYAAGKQALNNIPITSSANSDDPNATRIIFEPHIFATATSTDTSSFDLVDLGMPAADYTQERLSHFPPPRRLGSNAFIDWHTNNSSVITGARVVKVNFSNMFHGGGCFRSRDAQEEMLIRSSLDLSAITAAYKKDGHPLQTRVKRGALGLDPRERGDHPGCGVPKPLLFQGVRAQFDAIKGDSAAVRITPHLSPTANLDILAIAAPKIESFTASSYDPDTFNDLYQTARHAFQGVKAQYPGTPLEIETGLWGAGAFHNSKYLAVAIQYLAARASGIEGIHFKFNLPGISDNNVYVQSICATVDAFISTHQGKIALILPALAAKAKELESH